MAVRLTLYGRSGCGLCEEMKAIVQPIAVEWGCAVEEIDISTDAALEAEYGLRIPVLLIDGIPAFKHPISASALRRRLRWGSRRRRLTR